MRIDEIDARELGAREADRFAELKRTRAVMRNRESRYQ
jgi:hypothetical protein